MPEIPAPAPATAGPNADLKGKKVMIVEDDTLLHNLLSMRLAELRSEGIEVFPTFNGAQALKVASEQHPDLVLLDIMLPEMTGFEFLEKMRQDPALKDTPVVILSNLSGDQDKDKAKALGVREFFVKADFSLDDISSKIVGMLRGS